MKIVMITGSPHRHGTSALLADAFIQGAQEAGHTVFRFDAAFQELHPCRACERCHNTDKGCIYKDGMEELNPHLLEADLVAFASPIYYYDWSAQLKLAIDRFYANSTALRTPKKAVLLLTMEDDTEVECAILTIFPVDAKEYIALLPLDENGQNHDGEVYLYSFARTETGAPMLSNIESDEEYNKAAIAFDTVLQNAKEAEAAGIPLE